MLQGINRGFRAFSQRVSSLGGGPRDTPELREQKGFLITFALMILPAGFVWGTTYAFFKEYAAMLIPYGYDLLSVLSLLVFARTRNYAFFRLAQHLLILLLPFFLFVVLGGFVNSSAVILWSLLAPIAALVFYGPPGAWRWFVAYLALLLLGGILEGSLRASNNLPSLVKLLYFLMNIGAISAVAYVLLSIFMQQRNTAFRLLHVEQEKTENLLLNILPKEIAPRLKNNPGTIADHFDCASILFADIVNFTPWSEELPPNEMVAMLNELFSYFDALVDKYDVTKIRTIGDNYMCAAGVPIPQPDHAQRLACMALDMREYIRAFPPRHDKRLDFRIGINSGAVVAGVIGTKKFVYDLWGDPVNVAARMESYSIPGKIQITRSTFQLIKDEFNCEPRGILDIKGKGKMATWFLVGAKKH